MGIAARHGHNAIVRSSMSGVGCRRCLGGQSGYSRGRGKGQAIMRSCHDGRGTPMSIRPWSRPQKTATKGHGLCHEWGATDINMAIASAASGGHKSIIQLCRGWAPPMSMGPWPGPREAATNRSCGCAASGAPPKWIRPCVMPRKATTKDHAVVPRMGRHQS